MADEPAKSPGIRRGKGLRLSTPSPDELPASEIPTVSAETVATPQPLAETAAVAAPTSDPAAPVLRGSAMRLSTPSPNDVPAAATPPVSPEAVAPPPLAPQPAVAQAEAELSVSVLQRSQPSPKRSSSQNFRRSTTTARGTLSYLQAGTGSPLILLHGWGASARVWEPTLTEVGALRECYALDLPGFGQSPARAAVPSLLNLADEVIAFADALGFTHFDLVGHALGAAVAACVTARTKVGRVGRLVVTALGARLFAPDLVLLDLTRSPLDLTLGFARPLLNLWQPTNRTIMQSPPLASAMEALLIQRRPATGEVWQNYLADHAAADARAYLTSLTAAGDVALHDALRGIIVPTLCLAGREDRLVGQSYITAAHDLIIGSRLQVLADCGHIPMIDQPAAFHQALREFFNG